MALPAPVTSPPTGYLTFVPPPDAGPEQLSIQTRGLTKRYDHIVAVDSLDLRVRQGEVYGFLGPNGAGKTTTLRMLLGLIAPTSGSISMMGMEPGTPDSLSKIGAMIETPAFYPFLSGRDNLHMLAAYTGTPEGRIDEVLEQVDLTDRAGDAFKGYSLGMKQRLGVAAALLKNPPLLILDEPTNGLDPAGMADMRSLIRQLGRDGRTVLLSSHLMNEVEQVCDRVGVIARGRIVAEGTVSDLRGVDRLLVRVDQPLQARELLVPVPNVAALDISGQAVRLEADPGSEIDAAMVARLLVEGGVAVNELRHDRRSLEQVFLDLTGGH
jgi:ABC-2 type transport system ATP-binding protein